jgi:ABC-type lipoprotein export system ATPase subunit
MLVAFLALLAFLGGFGGKSAKNVECARGEKEQIISMRKISKSLKKIISLDDIRILMQSCMWFAPFNHCNLEHNMKRIVIKNVGPIKHVDVELKRFNFFIGPQSSGKSTIAKILSTCTWVEKEVATTLDANAIPTSEDFVELIEDFHKMSGYFEDSSEILYETNAIKLIYSDKTLNIELKDGINYLRKKICYIPAERNMVTLPELQGFEFGSTNLRSFLFDWFSAREFYSPANKSDILGLGVKYFYDKDEKKYKDRIEHINGRTYQIPLSSASSGLQSIIPLLIMLQYYSDEYYRKYKRKTSFDENDKELLLRKRLTDLLVIEPLYPNFEYSNRQIYLKIINDQINAQDPKYLDVLHNYQTAVRQLTVPTSTSFIVEEPEQNLFPSTQLEIIETMVRLCNGEKKHGFTVTTHSPYIINFLNILIARYYKEVENTSLNPDELNVFSVQDGRLVSQMQFNSASKHSSVNVDELTEAMQTMYDEYRELKRN